MNSTKCDVKKCRGESEIIVLGVELCDDCWILHTQNKPLLTLKGLLTFDKKGNTILEEKNDIQRHL